MHIYGTKTENYELTLSDNINESEGITLRYTLATIEP